MNIIVNATMEGTVYRRMTASGEDAWRLNSDGSWAHCADHKGPWVSTKLTDVPTDVIDNLLDYRATMFGTTYQEERGRLFAKDD